MLTFKDHKIIYLWEIFVINKYVIFKWICTFSAFSGNKSFYKNVYFQINITVKR